MGWLSDRVRATKSGVKKAANSVGNALGNVVEAGQDLGHNFDWNTYRDYLEASGALAGNYFLPGSSLLTSQLLSKGAKSALNDTQLGQLAQLGTGGAGAAAGNLANYSNVANMLGFGGSPAPTNNSLFNGGGLFGGQGSAFGTPGVNPGITGLTSFEGTSGLGLLGIPMQNAGMGGASSGGGFWNTVSGVLGGGGGSGGGGINWGQLLNLGGNALSGYMGAQAAKDAAKTQADAQREALALQEKMFNKQIGLNEPFRQIGLGAQNKLAGMLGVGGDTTAPGYGSLMKDFSMADYQADPGYAFRMSEGLKALDRSAAARGGLLSGSALKGAQRYGQDLASQEYQNAYNRYQTNRANKLQPLQSLGGLGQSAANTMGGYAGQYGQTAGEGLTNIGAAKAAGQMGATNAWTGAISGALGGYQDQQVANALRQSQYNRGY